METEDPNTVVFKSDGGDIGIVGMISFQQVKSNLTEIDYHGELRVHFPPLQCS